MDPNTTLANVRRLIGEADAASSLAGANLKREEALEEFIELDKWFSDGGFAPQAWLR